MSSPAFTEHEIVFSEIIIQLGNFNHNPLYHKIGLQLFTSIFLPSIDNLWSISVDCKYKPVDNYRPKER